MDHCQVNITKNAFYMDINKIIIFIIILIQAVLSCYAENARGKIIKDLNEALINSTFFAEDAEFDIQAIRRTITIERPVNRTIVFPYLEAKESANNNVELDSIFALAEKLGKKEYCLSINELTRKEKKSLRKKFKKIPNIVFSSGFSISFRLNDSILNIGNYFQFQLNKKDYRVLLDKLNLIKYIVISETRDIYYKSHDLSACQLTIDQRCILDYVGAGGTMLYNLAARDYKEETYPIVDFLQNVYSIAFEYLSKNPEKNEYMFSDVEYFYKTSVTIGKPRNKRKSTD